MTKRKKILKRKKKKKQSLSYISLRDSEKSLIECINNNSQSENKSVLENNSNIGIAKAGKQSLSEEPEANSDSEGYTFPAQKDESDDCCMAESCEDSLAKENSKGLKWEKLKPINCKIRNSKIIYQNEVTVIEANEERGDMVNNKNKIEVMKKNKFVQKSNDEDDSDFFLCRRTKVEVLGGEGEKLIVL